MPSHSPDAIVIGAGIIGASIAWKLAHAGLNVCMLDAGTMGGEASWAGAGMLALGGEVETRDIWSDLALESLQMYPEYVARLESESGIPIDFRRCGAVEVAFDGEEYQALARRAELQRPLGIPSLVLDDAELRKLVPLFDREAACALFYPTDAIVDPRDIMHALRTACSTAGVEIREGWRAARIKLAAESVQVESERGDVLHAGAAVLAAGAWSSQVDVSGITIPPWPRAFPVKGHLTGYNCSPRTLGPILRRGHTYLLQRSNGFTIAGTSSEQVGFNRSIDAAVVNDITARICELLPALKGERPAAVWAGFRPGAESAGPVIQRAGDSHLWLAYGHYRNGILLAPVTAGKISREIAGGRATQQA
jgi:glycine oxidase